MEYVWWPRYWMTTRAQRLAGVSSCRLNQTSFRRWSIRRQRGSIRCCMETETWTKEWGIFEILADNYWVLSWGSSKRKCRMAVRVSYQTSIVKSRSRRFLMIASSEESESYRKGIRMQCSTFLRKKWRQSNLEFFIFLNYEFSRSSSVWSIPSGIHPQKIIIQDNLHGTQCANQLSCHCKSRRVQE